MAPLLIVTSLLLGVRGSPVGESDVTRRESGASQQIPFQWLEFLLTPALSERGPVWVIEARL